LRSLKTIVLGLGNLMRTDDAAGVLAARALDGSGRLPKGIDVIEGGTLGLDLLGIVHGVSHLLVLDAVDFGAAPGTLARFEGAAISQLPTSKSVHLLGLSDLLNVLQLMEAPAMEVVLFGVQPESTEWGTELTPPVMRSQPELIEVAIRQIMVWVHDATRIGGLTDAAVTAPSR
jgi:hydrogenase maturation protease